MKLLLDIADNKALVGTERTGRIIVESIEPVVQPEVALLQGRKTVA